MNCFGHYGNFVNQTKGSKLELRFPYVVCPLANEFSQMFPIFLFIKNPFNDINNLAPLHLISSFKKGKFYERDQKYEKRS